MSGKEFSGKDAYRISGYEKHRAGMKKMVSAMLYAARPLKRWPTDLAAEFPKGTRLRDVLTAISEAHRPISNQFYTGIGLKAMFIESSILVEVLLRLMEEEIIALPLHDAVLTARPHIGTVRDTMMQVYEKHLGVVPTVNEE
jgi:hypothetical protein